MDHRDLVKRFYKEIWNEGRKEAASEILSEDFKFRGSTGLSMIGGFHFLQYVDLIRRALSGYNCHIEEFLSEKDSACARMTFSGKHTGRFFGVKPTGKDLTWSGAAIFKFRANQICELWVLGDIDSIKQQLDLTSYIAP